MTTEHFPTPKKRMKHNYIDNKKLYTEMVKYINQVNEAKEKGIPKEKWPVINDYIGKSVYDIAINLARKSNFSGYSYKDDMIGDAIENCLMYIHNFNPDKSNNPFAYFTQIMYYAFLRRIGKEQKQQYIRQKSMIESVTMNTVADMAAEDSTQFAGALDFDMDKYKNFVDKFETTNKIKSKKKKGLENFMEEEDVTTDNSTDD